MERNQVIRSWNCPKSGVLLGVFVKAFDLGNPDVGGERAAKHIGSDPSLGRAAREYFRGEWVAEPRQRDICRWVVDAAFDAGLLSKFALPMDASGRAPDAKEFLADVLHHVLSEWDAIYLQGSMGWPDPHPSLAAYVLGRQLVIELALRVTALLQLTGGCDWPRFVIHVTDEKPGKAIISSMMQRASRHVTREELARSIGVEKSTVDDWMDMMTVPRDANMRALAKHFARSADDERELLGWLRLQWSLISIRVSLAPHLELAHLIDLFSAFMCLVQLSLDMQSRLPLPREALLVTQVLTLRMSTRLDASKALFGYWLNHQSSPLWIDDIVVAGEKGPAARIQECFEVIGDRSAAQALWNHEMGNVAGLSTDRESLHVQGLLIAMSPRALWSASPSFPEPSLLRNCTPDVLAWIGKGLMDRGEYSKAIGVWRRAVELEPDCAETRLHLGIALWQAKNDPRLDEAIEQLSHACRLRPDWAYPVAEIAKVYLHRGWPENAVQYLESAPAALVQGSVDCLYALALSLYRLKRFDAAGRVARQALELEKTCALAAHIAAECAFALGDKVEGGRLAREALRLGDRRSYDRWLRPSTG
ncbi:MAG: tetratricopeptide repeat protein [Phycisphaeraceae bacterium]|nr:tetratricopeptide repeat protein [Phycisphaeraceae bacterium]QYK49167.1 MAG: tetratricopeptide repeat protein [Phycisphaeraceae bacterium]